MKGQLFVDLVGEDWLVRSQLSGMQGRAKREPREACKPENELVSFKGREREGGGGGGGGVKGILI